MVINDINSDVMRIYHAIKTDYEAFLKRLNCLESEYMKFPIPTGKSPRWQHGFPSDSRKNYYLNGRYGTPSGLLNQKTEVYDREVVKWWHEALQSTEILSGDWRDVPYTHDEETFAFFDPPYRLSFADYGNGFGDEDLIELVNKADMFEHVMLSNRNDDDRFDNTLNHHDIEITYTAGRRKKTAEGFEAKKTKEK